MQPKPITAREFIRSIIYNHRPDQSKPFEAYLKGTSQAAPSSVHPLEDTRSGGRSSYRNTLQRLLINLISPGSPSITHIFSGRTANAGHGQNGGSYGSQNRMGFLPDLIQLLVPKNKDYLSENFLKSTKQHLGEPYSSLDCYELVIQGIKNMGFHYEGMQGIKAHLIKMATARGLPINTYLTGEGLLEAIGKTIYSRQITPTKHLDQQSENILGGMKPLLNAGYLLTFSTPTRGHVGIVSGQHEQWRFLNSGKMDHQISGANHGQQVGEETLLAEIRNWVQLAHDRSESLQITLGKLDDQKLYAFVKPGARFNKRV